MKFNHLNEQWAATPDAAPNLVLTFVNRDAHLKMPLAPAPGRSGNTTFVTISFHNCSRWDWDASERHAWYDGLYPAMLPALVSGGFYEVVGGEEARDAIDWEVMSPDFPKARQFLLCFSDDTLGFVASEWTMSITEQQA